MEDEKEGLAKSRRKIDEIDDQIHDLLMRRTEIVHDHASFNPEDLITPEDVVVTLSHAGYVKWQSVDVYATDQAYFQTFWHQGGK